MGNPPREAFFGRRLWRLLGSDETAVPRESSEITQSQSDAINLDHGLLGGAFVFFEKSGTIPALFRTLTREPQRHVILRQTQLLALLH